MIPVLILGLTAAIVVLAGHLAVKAFDEFNDPIINQMCRRQDAMERDLIVCFKDAGRELPPWVSKVEANHGKHWRYRKKVL